MFKKNSKSKERSETQMAKGEPIGRDDIPGVDEVKHALLVQLISGRQRSFESAEKGALSFLKVSAAQKKYKISSSETTLLGNRFIKARAELASEALIEYPSKGKIKLTQAGKNALSINVFDAKDEPSNGDLHPLEKHKGLSKTVDSSLEKTDRNENGDTYQNLDASPSQIEPGLHQETDQKDQKNSSATEEKKVSTEPKETVGLQDFSSNIDGSGKGFFGKYRPYLSLALAALGLILCLSGAGLLGVVSGGVGLLIKKRDTASKSAANPAAPKTTIGIGVCSIVLGVVLTIGSCSNGVEPQPAEERNNLQKNESVLPEETTGTLSFKVVAPDWADKNTPIEIDIQGSDLTGKNVSEHYKAKAGIAYPLACKAGSYTFTVSQGSLVNGGVIFSATPPTFEFDGKNDHVVEVALTKDVQATEAAQKAKKDAEEKAAQQAVEKKKAEEDAAAAAAAAVAAAEEAAAAERSAAAEPVSKTVYITNTGEKYHSGGCRYLKESKIATSYDDAKAQGYEACKVCRPG